jgi:O-antigen/teichoic acid export membrane protein
MVSNLTSQTIHGIKWSYASTITNAFVQIIYTAIMARLLDPVSFGLIAMSSVILRFGSYFSQMGMGSALIQKKTLTDSDIRSGFTSSVLISLLFLCLVYFLSPFALLVFNNPELVPIIRVMAISFIFTGLSTTSLAIIRRNFNFKSLAIIEIISYIFSYGAIGIISALLGFGVWSLVFASLSQALLSAILSYLAVKHSLLFLFSWKSYKPLFSFGSKISGITFFQFIGANLDTLLIGKFSGASSLGIYNRTSLLINLPGQYLFASLSRVLFPAFSQIQTDNKKLTSAYLYSLTFFSIILIPVTIGIIPMAQNIITFYLGSKWIDAVPVFQILLVSIIFASVINISGSILQAVGKLKKMFLIEILHIAVLIVSIISLAGYGLIGFAIAVTISRFIRFIFYLVVVNNHLGLSYSKVVKLFFINTAAGLAIFSGISIVTLFLSQTSNYLTILTQLMAFLILYSVFFKTVAIKYFNEELSFFLNKLTNMFGKKALTNRILLFLNKKVLLAK